MLAQDQTTEKRCPDIRARLGRVGRQRPAGHRFGRRVGPDQRRRTGQLSDEPDHERIPDALFGCLVSIGALAATRN